MVYLRSAKQKIVIAELLNAAVLNVFHVNFIMITEIHCLKQNAMNLQL